MRELGSIPAKAAIEKLADYLDHRDADVARCAVQGLMETEDETLLLVSGSLIARRLGPKSYRPERRELYVDMVYALGASRYLGAFDQLKAMLRKVQDGEVVALAAETLALLMDYRAISVLEDWASWDTGYNDGPGTVADTGRRRQLPAGTKPTVPRFAGSPLQGTNRQNSAREAWPKPGEQWVRDAVYEAFFKLIGREGRGFDSYDEYTKFMVSHREEHKAKAQATEGKAREQEKKIRACP